MRRKHQKKRVRGTHAKGTEGANVFNPDALLNIDDLKGALCAIDFNRKLGSGDSGSTGNAFTDSFT